MKELLELTPSEAHVVGYTSRVLEKSQAYNPYRNFVYVHSLYDAWNNGWTLCGSTSTTSQKNTD